MRAAHAGTLAGRAFERREPIRGGLVVVAAGKASGVMAAEAVRRYGARIRGGLIVAPKDSGGLDDTAPSGVGALELIQAGHPVPDADSERAGRRALALAGALGARDTLLVLLSGGASALIAVPAEGLTLENKRSTTKQLLRAGADIRSFNTVRKHLSALKGGWLAARAAGRCLTLSLSDVVGDDPSVIGSGPTVADASTYRESLDVLRRHGGLSAYPAAVVSHLEGGASGLVPETPKPGDERLASASWVLIGSRRDAMAGAAKAAEARGYHAVIVRAPVAGDARVEGPRHVAAVLARGRRAPRPLCVVSSGETTVRVVGKGRGGRNQEFVLGALPAIDAASEPLVFASVGTDGVDGPTDAAGAVADRSTMARARDLGLAGPAFLDDNNAYAFFDRMGDLIRTGATGTNVGDLQVALLE